MSSSRSAPESRVDMLEFAIGALRSNQDVLLHKVERTQVVRDQLALNLAAIRALSTEAALQRPTPECPGEAKCPRSECRAEGCIAERAACPPPESSR